MLFLDRLFYTKFVYFFLYYGGKVSRFHSILGASAYGYQHPAHPDGA